MRIFSLNHTYYVVQRFSKNDDYEILFCQEEDEGNAEYTMIRIWNQSLSYPIIPIFMDLMNHDVMDDFKECFSDDGTFCLVFHRYQGIRIREKLEQERLLLIERLIIGERLLEHIILLNMPEFVLKEVLKPENIVVTGDLSVQFLYIPDQLFSDKKKAKSLILQRLEMLMQLLFQQEIVDESCKELTDFIECIRKKPDTGMIELYREFHEIRMVLSDKERAGVIKPGRFWFRVWERAKRLFLQIKPFVYAAVLVLVALFLVYTVTQGKPESKEKTVFHYIGDMEIDTLDEGTQK